MTHKSDNCEVGGVLTNLILVIISQAIHVSNHHIIHLKLTQCCMLLTFQKSREGETNTAEDSEGSVGPSMLGTTDLIASTVQGHRKCSAPVL